MMTVLYGTDWLNGVSSEFVNKLAENNGAADWSIYNNQPIQFDAEVFKDVALRMILDAGVKPYLYTLACHPIMVKDKVKGIIIESKSGRQAILAEDVVDCTGDADIAYRAGAPFTFGREEDSKARPFTLLFRLGGLNVPEIERYIKENPDECQWAFRDRSHVKIGKEDVIGRLSGFYSLVEKAKANGELYPECHYFRFETLWVNRGISEVNTVRVYNVDGTNAQDLTKAEIHARDQIKKLLHFVRKYMPGCQNAYIIDTATRLGVRQSRKLLGEFKLMEEDVYNNREFEDAIARTTVSWVDSPRPENYDAHMPDPIEGSKEDIAETTPYILKKSNYKFQISYRTLLPQKVDNILVAGRCISVSHFIDGLIRLMLIAMHTGQVCGIAAALSAKKSISPKLLNYNELTVEMEKQGMKIDK